MKTIHEAEFRQLLKDPNWFHEQDVDILNEDSIFRNVWNIESEIEELHRCTVVQADRLVCSKLNDMTITYSQKFDYDECEPSSVSDDDPELHFDGFFVVDDDGDFIDPFELIDYVEAHKEFVELPDHGVQDVIDDEEFDESSDDETHEVRVSYLPDIKFTGKLVASHTYDVMTGRYIELAFYQTISGKFVCHAVRRTQWQDEEDFFQGEVCDTLEQAHSFFKSYKGASTPGNQISDLFVL